MTRLAHTGRRRFLAGCASLAGVAAAGRAWAGIHGTGDGDTAHFLAARRHEGRHEVALIDAAGHDVSVLALPDRGHSFAIDLPRQRAVAFGRQPGFFALAFTLPACNDVQPLPLPEDRHFFGHGVFSADGARLFATENDFEAGRGVVGVYDARPGRQWQRLGEFDTAGIGPHELVLMPDGRTLCVANGGLLTHPDYGKDALNLSTMRPSLVYLDAQDGALLEKVELDPSLYQLSIRHLALARGEVWFACQHQGPATEQPPLLGRHRRGEAPQLLAAPRDLQRDLRNYIGSIAADAQGRLAASSPVGGHVAFWDAASGRCLGGVARPDGCGVAPLQDGHFLVSDGFGAIAQTGPGDEPHLLVDVQSGMAWDNHLRRL